MILTAIAFMMLTQDPAGQSDQAAQAPPQKPTSVRDLMGLTLKHYFEAKSAAGKIHLTQQARGVTLTIDTEFAYDRPSKFFVRQVKNNSGDRWYSVSDGKLFRYQREPGSYGRSRETEPVSQHGVTQTIENMYPSAIKTMADRSAVLDVMFARKADLDDFRSHLKNLKLTGRTQIRGQEVNVVEGDYCEIPGEEPTGVFQLSITDNGDLVRYAVKNRYAIPNQPSETVEVLSTWDVDAKVGVTNPDSVYSLKD